MPDNRYFVTHEGEALSFDEEDASVPLLTVERRWGD